MKLTPELEKVYSSKWVEPKKSGLGYKLKPGAPESVKKKFNEAQKLVNGK